MTTAAQLNPLKTRQMSAPVHQDHFTLAMALHYLRSSGSNVPGATRKAVQALGALNRLEMLSVGSGARTTGRA